MDIELKKQRRQLILNATKELALENGLQDVSARNIGERCGMSYATLYNYFKDVNELLAYVAVDFLQDSYDYVTTYLNSSMSVKEQILELSDRYYEYMISNPNRFKVIFIQDFGNITNELAVHLIPKVSVLLKELLNEINEDQLVLNRELTFQMITSSMHAKLMFQVFKRTSTDASFDKQQLRKEIIELVK